MNILEVKIFHLCFAQAPGRIGRAGGRKLIWNKGLEIVATMEAKLPTPINYEWGGWRSFDIFCTITTCYVNPDLSSF